MSQVSNRKREANKQTTEVFPKSGMVKMEMGDEYIGRYLLSTGR